MIIPILELGDIWIVVSSILSSMLHLPELTVKMTAFIK